MLDMDDRVASSRRETIRACSGRPLVLPVAPPSAYTHEGHEAAFPSRVCWLSRRLRAALAHGFCSPRNRPAICER